MNTFNLTPGQISLQTLRQLNQEEMTIILDKQAISKINASATFIKQTVDNNQTVYGVNTGFGLLANTKIPNNQLEDLQRRIVLSHAAGIGDYFSDATTRLIMVLKINSLARGFSGIRYQVIDSLIQLVNRQIYPCIPSKGSVGASGDLAPLAHMSAILLGQGFARYQGEIISASAALKIANLSPLTLQAKEGLALLNGTQVSTALALQGLFYSEDLYASASVVGAMTTEAVLGSRKPFDAKIHQARGLQSQIDAAAILRELLSDASEIGLSHQNCDRVQDPYSIRCQPQVMGACLTQIRNAAEVLVIEANGVTDNPLIFVDEGEVISGGNFHAEPIAMVADNLALAISEIGALSERRMALLVDKNLSQLPPFLVDNGGINSGFMIAQVTSAALASENKCLATPASIDSLPTSANQEDHVSMATYGARRLKSMSENSAAILGIEYLGAAQGLDFRHPSKTSISLEAAKSLLRESVPFYDEDRYFSHDIGLATEIVFTGQLNKFIHSHYLPSL